MEKDSGRFGWALITFQFMRTKTEGFEHEKAQAVNLGLDDLLFFTVNQISIVLFQLIK